jgi:hypothetical protein
MRIVVVFFSWGKEKREDAKDEGEVRVSLGDMPIQIYIYKGRERERERELFSTSIVLFAESPGLWATPCRRKKVRSVPLRPREGWASEEDLPARKIH